LEIPAKDPFVLFLNFYLFIFETGSNYVAWTDLELSCLLFLSARIAGVNCHTPAVSKVL
jgi:hypothetical protein